jgi:riboflavin synthase
VFTGLVQAIGTVRDAITRPNATRILIDPGELLAASAPAPAFAAGESISVSGVCLTLADNPADHAGFLAFDAVAETLRRTSLGGLLPGSTVNLERSVTPSTLLGGHVVQGHVDGLAEVVSVQQGDDWRVRLRPLPVPDANPMEYLVPKGSVTLDGVSLTVAALGSDWFEIALIPVTLARTTLGELVAGQLVNIEFDAMVKTIVHWLRHFAPSGR